MERIRCLNRYQKCVLAFMMGMMLLFAMVYARAIARVGYAYQGVILAASQENGGMVYAGKLYGKPARFTVSEDKTVVFQYGDQTYGPYTAKTDPAAVPRDEELSERMTGVELLQGETVVFRGGVLDVGDSYWLYNEDGSFENIEITFTGGDGLTRDENGNVIDPVEPSAVTILELMNTPALTHQGEWSVWIAAAFICVCNALSILFADELFRLRLSFQIRTVDHAEPSDWVVAGRYIVWTIAPLGALTLLILGLQ